MNRKKKNNSVSTANHDEMSPRLTDDILKKELNDNILRIEKILGKEKFMHLIKEASWQSEDSGEKKVTLPDPITADEWAQTHPANLVCGSDQYYANLANDLYKIISSSNLPPSAPEQLPRETARVLAAYLEDLVSETKVFSAMRRVCMQKYGYRLPFYDCEHADYLPDHINEEDIKFLIWKTACLLGKEKRITYSPLAPGWQIIAEKIFDVLDSRYEEAKEAIRVRDWLGRIFRKGDYIDIREAAYWLVFCNPLTYIPGYLDDIEKEADDALLDTDIPPHIVSQVLYACTSQESWQRSMSPMGCPSKTLVSAMAAEFGYGALSKDIEEIEIRPKQCYAIIRDTKSSKIFFETSAHEKLQVQRSSFAKGFKPDVMEYAECELLKFRGQYLLNGMLRGEPSMKKEWEEQAIMPSDAKQREFARKWIDALDGKQAVCVSNLNTLFTKLYLPGPTHPDILDVDNFVVLFSKDLARGILPGMGYAFNISGNRFYRKRKAAEESFADLIFGNAIPHDVATYIQDNHLLPQASIGASQGKETGLRIVQDYLAFWIGFYRELPSYGEPPISRYYDDASNE